MSELLIATRNRNKLREMAELFAPHGVSVRSIAECPDAPETVEDGESFAANAAKKATEAARHLACWAVGEDSGLCVDALGGRPGIFSARFAGEGASDADNNDRLIQKLTDVPDHARTAGYLCSVAVADPTGVVRLTAEATCRGRITREPRGGSGFGYDPYFLLPEYHRTFGELPPVVKRHLSHRARAFSQAAGAIAALIRRG